MHKDTHVHHVQVALHMHIVSIDLKTWYKLTIKPLFSTNNDLIWYYNTKLVD